MKDNKLLSIDKKAAFEILEVIQKHRDNAYRKVNE